MEERAYNKLTCPEDSSDDHSLTVNEEEQQVSLTIRRHGAFVNCRKVMMVLLCVLAVVLLIVDIGLSVYYRNLTDRESIVRDMNAEVAKLKRAYKKVLEERIELKRDLAQEALQQQLTKWELDHQKTKNADYQKESEKLLSLTSGLRSHIPLLKEGCRHCLPRWLLINSMCYYFPFSENAPRRSWEESQVYCKNFGADLIKLNSRQKQLAIHNVISQNAVNGYWIGVRDVDEEGVWKWTDGTQLNEGFWIVGEPNNQGNEDCAAVFSAPTNNPFRSWNDAPCSHHLKWICEKVPN